MTGTPRPPDVAATRARQGARSPHMIWVLIVSVVLGAVVVVAAWAWMSGGLSRAGKRSAATPADAAAFHTPAPPNPPPTGG
ncbi:MAG TPA: hypothetical protein VFC47_03690 [Caulobacteraceae bacterium]|nr:hypothetical protein [Caulobacteraceae bacterium]